MEVAGLDMTGNTATVFVSRPLLCSFYLLLARLFFLFFSFLLFEGHPRYPCPSDKDLFLLVAGEMWNWDRFWVDQLLLELMLEL